MADNVTLPGTGEVVTADELADGSKAQGVKLLYSANADGTPVGADANGLDVDVTRLPAPLGAAGATSIAKAEDAASATADVGIPAMAIRKATPANTSDTDGDYEMLQISAGRLWVSGVIDTALPAGTNAIGKLAANSGVDIGDVDVTSLTGGTIAHDAADSGNPIKVGARAAPTGANTTLVAVADRSDLVTDLDGALITRPFSQLGDMISDVKTVTDGSSTAFSGSFAATANVRHYITGISMWNTSATTVTVDLRDGTAGSVIWTGIVPAGSGNNFTFNPPLRQPTVNTALAMDPSAAATTVGVSVSGFKSKV